MIYLKNNTEKQTIFIPRNELQKEAFITTIKTYEDGYKEGYEDGAASIQIDLENKSIDIVSNGEYTVTPTDGFDALESVKISVDVPNEGNCNLEDKIIAPQTNEVDGYGYIYIRPNEGYDGMIEVALHTSNLKNVWFNEGYEQGKSQGGECNIQADKLLEPQLSEIEEGYLYVYPDEGYVGMSRTTIHTANLKEGWYNEGYEQGKEEGGNCNLSHQLEVIETNGRHYFRPQDNGWDGYDFFEVEVDVPTTAKLQDVWVTPSMADRDGNNLLVYSPNTDEGYDGLSRVVIDPQTIYNEGVEKGFSEGKTEGYNDGYNKGYTDGYNEGSNQLSNNVLEGDMVLSFQLNDNNFPDLRNDGEGIFMWDGFKVPLYIKRPNGCGELYLSGNYDKNIAPSLQSKFFQDDDYAKIEKLTINLHIIPNNIVNVVNLKELHLTENVEMINENAFQDVYNLKTIYCHYGDGLMYATKDSFVGLPNNGTLFVKKSAQPSWGWIEDLGWTIVNI